MIHLDSAGSFASCTPFKVYLPNSTQLRLPMSYCAQVCDSSFCHAFRLQDEECHIIPLLLTSGYSMTQEEPNALPFYHLSMKHYYPNTDLAYHATVTAASNAWVSPSFEKDLTDGVLCTRLKCPCTSAKNHSVVVDLGASVYVKEVHAVTYSPPQIYSQNFYAYPKERSSSLPSSSRTTACVCASCKRSETRNQQGRTLPSRGHDTRVKVAMGCLQSRYFLNILISYWKRVNRGHI